MKSFILKEEGHKINLPVSKKRLAFIIAYKFVEETIGRHMDTTGPLRDVLDMILWTHPEIKRF